ncbi:hypothetical protein DQW50_00465 [Halorubrum sp. 48-1-W]|uniref:hypothetical protein n=1 Tax=Halorubrum sp. 48-1-W TaxID=2249761 RepID=UPI000DCF0DBC|nr:hypothetical protein [Halorubrum sp. 48-1-W]RAW46901.1 hypothetical protein DQW50_00465 [Halorubrum sp. 48-1-W]
MQPTAQALARTYSDREYPDPWEKVLDYRRVQEYAAEHPKHGRTRVGNALDLPPSRVRGWLDDGMPDPVRGIQTAIDHGWLDPDPDGDMATALVELLAHVLAGGSVSDVFVPAVSSGRRIGPAMISEAFEAVGVDAQTRHVDSDSRATELYPATDASVLGRCLVAMGAPKGSKTGLSAVPAVVWDSPDVTRRRFVEIYVAHRGAHLEGKATTRIQEERPESYLEDLHRLITECVTDEVSVGPGGLTISADAARELQVSQQTE